MVSWRRVVGLAVGFAVLAMVPVIVGWGSIPDPFASHWGANGSPDAYLSKWWLPVLPLILIAIGSLIAGFLRRGGRPSAEGIALLSFMGAMGVVAITSTVLLNHGATSWDQADPLPWVHLLAIIALPLLSGIVGYLVGRSWYPLEAESSDSIPEVIPVSPGEKVAWVGTCQVRYPLIFVGLAALAMVLLPPGIRLVALPFFLAGLLLSHVRVTVSNAGLRARLGGVFVRRFELAEIKHANMIELEPAQWGGWGYRMVPGRTAMVLRRGEAIDLHLNNGRRFAVTVDDAAIGAGLINGLLALDPTRQHPAT